ncbi:MAG: hypothetical protein JNM72_27200 [Deltaproteobacteria bacterium]|nr:hypothetical protein [Deltaproteobacteria bacterium]
MNVKCAACAQRFQAPFHKHLAQCSQCGREVLVNPEWPFTRPWFWVILAIPYAAALVARLWIDPDTSSTWFWMGLVLVGAIYWGLIRARGSELPAPPGGGPGAPDESDWHIIEIHGVIIGREAPHRGGPGARLLFYLGFLLGLVVWAWVYLIYLMPVVSVLLALDLSNLPEQVHTIVIVAPPILVLMGLGRFRLGAGPGAGA